MAPSIQYPQDAYVIVSAFELSLTSALQNLDLLLWSARKLSVCFVTALAE